jgi:hypothetical protein
MEMDELRRRLGMILAAEEKEPADWSAVERLASELQRQLHTDVTPEIVSHYLDDADIRARSETYAVGQRRKVRRFVELGEYDDGTPVPLWGCTLVLVTGASLALWLAL